MAECQEQHTSFDPPDDLFKCPSCGAKAGVFAIDDTAAPDTCNRLHNEDQLLCHECGHRTTGEEFIRLLQDKANLMPCPHCQGKGMVPQGGS